MSALPPPEVVRAAEKTRADLQKQVRELAPPPFALLELAMGSMITQALYVAAKLSVAEALADGPLPIEELAGKVGAHAEALGRTLRLLAANGVFERQADGRWALTPMADALRADHPVTMRDLAVLMGHPAHWDEWNGFVDSVVTGEPSLPKRRGASAFEYFMQDQEYGAAFIGGMGNMSVTETEPVVAAYDFSQFGTVVDFCGGNGGLLAGILKSAPTTKGILSDPRVGFNGAGEYLAAQGVADRTEITDGDMFAPVVEGGDAYVLKHIVHDWPQEQALQILRNIRAACKPGAKLLLVEMVVPEEGNEPHSGKLVDLWLLLLVGGKERNPAQYAELVAEAGFKLERVVETAAAVSIVEAVAV
ncbi:methyltransferase [Kitasatospora sp. LaBMicrA B282]|uniref:methyltransferase n=1 Tax=Kitasatospora sp. LaBMicrA B282 TaxID=3420949 RepID=UPI003D0E8A19